MRWPGTQRLNLQSNESGQAKRSIYQESRRDIFGSLPMITQPFCVRALFASPVREYRTAGISEGAVGRLALLL